MRISYVRALVLGLMLGSLCYAPLRAEEGMMGGGHEEWHGGMEHWHHMLGLTDDQVNKLKSIHEESEKAMKPLWRKERDLTIKLHDQLDDKVSDSDIKSTLSALRSNKEAMKDQKKKFQAQKDEILTPTQQAKMMMFKHMHRMHEDMHEGWEHHGEMHHDGDMHHDQDHDDGGESAGAHE